MHVVQLHLPVADQAEPIPQVGLSRPHRFHFRAQQLDPRFQDLENVVLMAGEAIVRQDSRLVLVDFSAVAPAARALCHDAVLLALLNRD